MFLFIRPFTTQVSGLVSMAGTSTQVRQLWGSWHPWCVLRPWQVPGMAFAKGLSFFALHPKARGGQGRWEAGVQSSPAPAQGSQCHPSPRERVRGASLVRAATSSPVWSAVCLERKASAPVSSCGDLTKRFHRVIWRIDLKRSCRDMLQISFCFPRLVALRDQGIDLYTYCTSSTGEETRAAKSFLVVSVLTTQVSWHLLRPPVDPYIGNIHYLQKG